MQINKAIFVIVLFACGCRQQTWKSLFNGNDLTSWEVKAKPEDIKKEFWKVKDGYIEANSIGVPDHDYVWLMTDREYRDFELKFRFQAFHDSPGNSGVQVRSRYDEANFWLNGPQIDIHPQGYWRTGMMWDETKGNQRWIFPNILDGGWVDTSMVLTQHRLYFSDEGPGWNDMLVRVEGLKIKSFLNGDMITDFDGAGILDDEIHKKWEVGESGYIAFQIHTGDELHIRFKDIYIKEIH